jgi:hypothetical protein
VAVTWGQTIGVNAQIKRSGNLGAGAFQVQWYLSRTMSIASDSVRLSLTSGATSYSHKAITASTTQGPLFTVTLQLPTGLPSGWSGTSFYLIMKTDSGNAVTESNENNNAGQVGSGKDRWGITIRSATTNQAPTVATPAAAASSPVTGTSVALSVLGADDRSESGLVYRWSVIGLPSGVTAPTFSANGTNAAKSTVATFHAAGTYTFQVTITDVSGLTATSTVQVTVSQTLTSLLLIPASMTVSVDSPQLCTAQAFDQFGKALTTQPTFSWEATQGTISSSGFYTAPATVGTDTITVTAGSLSATCAVTIVSGTYLNMTDADLAALTQSLYADGSISRLDMIQILQSVGSDDNVVDATELASLQIIVASASSLGMAGYVQVLASDVVNGNTANAHYQNSTLGNLAVGSSNTQLTKLINKWFYGTDLPTLTNQLYSHVAVAGSLFVNGASYNDIKQGELGDCYLLAALGAIAKSSPAAITHMFIANGDGTWTVRFYYQSGSTYVADYVTVNNMLAVSNNVFVYAGAGRSYKDSSNELWVLLAEKAYAQWNETGRAEQDNTNTYAGIYAGYSSLASSQILASASMTYGFVDANKQKLITAIAANKAVTASFTVTAAGLYRSHAYILVGYNSSKGTFQFYNPWGYSHPGALTWAQLKSYGSSFVIGDFLGTSTASTTIGSAVTASFESSLTPLDHPQAATSPEPDRAVHPTVQTAQSVVSLKTDAADVCYRSWEDDSLWSSQLRARRSAAGVLDDLVSLAART